MSDQRYRRVVLHGSLWVALILEALVVAPPVGAHCDSLDGPVVGAARAALEIGEVTPVLKWVREDDERDIRDALEKTLAVRQLGSIARDLADMYFFETVVRIHREGEGAPYTGLKPAGTTEPAAAAADEALEKGSAEELVRNLSAEIAEGLGRRYSRVIKNKARADMSVEAGREFVHSYTEFVHYVVGLHQAAEGADGSHEEASLRHHE